MKAIILFFVLLIPLQAEAEGPGTSTEKLDTAIEEVIQQREYQWRMPREVVEEEEQGLLFDFLEGMANTFKRAWKPIARVWNKVTDWLRRQLSSPGPTGSGREWTKGELNLLIVILIIVAALMVLFFLWRHRKSKRELEPMQAEAIVPLPDLSDENLIADQLPEEGWQKLAQDLIARGELRLALRALFMATLAHLAGVQLITVARFKSNRDYLQELKRRAYDRKPIQEAFHQNVSDVDRVWYGMYPVTEDLLNRFLANVEIVKQAAV
jgi:hypothetical protein